MNEEGLISGLREDQLVTAEEVDSALRESIEQSIGQAAFQQSKEGALKRLAGLQKPFKYVVSVLLLQKLGAGVHIATAELWDTNTDGKFTVHWENPTIVVLATVYWTAN